MCLTKFGRKTFINHTNIAIFVFKHLLAANAQKHWKRHVRKNIELKIMYHAVSLAI